MRLKGFLARNLKLISLAWGHWEGGGVQESKYLACVSGPRSEAEGFKCVAVAGTTRALITLPLKARLRFFIFSTGDN